MNGGGGTVDDVYFDNLQIDPIGGTPQVAKPNADVATNSWVDNAGGTTNLYAALDEAAASDADFAASPVAATTSSYLEVALEDVTDPSSSADHKVRYRYGKPAGGGTTDLTVSLRQGGTQIASWAHTGVAAGWTTAEQTLSGAEADAITDYTDLRLRFAPTAAAPGTPAKVADRGTTQNLTGAASSTVSVTANTTVGNTMVARVAVDNSGTSGAGPGCTVTDARGNTWVQLGTATVDPAGANAGISAYVFLAHIATQLLTGDLVTFTWGAGNPAAKAIVLEEWSNIDPLLPLVASNNSTGVATNAVSIGPVSPTAANQVVHGTLATEGPNTDTPLSDTDTTNGSWSNLTRLSTASGTQASNATVAGQSKVVTASGGQTWNGTISGTRDWAGVLVVLRQGGTRARVSWAQLEVPAVAAATYVDLDDPAPAGIGLQAVAFTASVDRELDPATAGVGLTAVALTPSVVRNLAPGTTGVGLQAVALTPAVVRELEGPAMGVGFGSTQVADLLVPTVAGVLLEEGTTNALLTQGGDRLAYIGAPAATYEDLDLAPAGIGLEVVAFTPSVERELELTVAGIGLTAVALTPSVERELELATTGVGLEAVAFTPAVVRELEVGTTGVGLDVPAVPALGVARSLALTAAGVGLQSSPFTPTVVRALAPAATGIGLEAVAITPSVVRELELGVAGVGLGAAPLTTAVAYALSPGAAGIGLGTTGVDDLLGGLTLVVLDPAATGVGLHAVPTAVAILRSLELTSTGLGLSVPPADLAVVRGLEGPPVGLGLGASQAALGVVRELEVGTAGVGLHATPGALSVVRELEAAAQGFGLHVSEVDSLLEDITLVLLDPGRGTVGLGSAEGALKVVRSLGPAEAGLGFQAVAASLGVVRELEVGQATLGLGTVAATLGLARALELAATGVGLNLVPAPVALLVVTVPPSWWTGVAGPPGSPTVAILAATPTRVVMGGGSPTGVES